MDKEIKDIEPSTLQNTVFTCQMQCGTKYVFRRDRFLFFNVLVNEVFYLLVRTSTG